MSFRQLIPANLRLFLKVNQRKWNDLVSKQVFNSRAKFSMNFEHEVSIVQPIIQNSNVENKIHNLRQGIESINDVILQAGEIFSFWKNVCQPNAQNGYKLSRNIVDGELKEDFGGGLCQLSSILYHLALISGLKIIERHNHSVDIYREEDRFTPLGADATVVYGYKDLRIQNPFDFPVQFSLSIDCNKLKCTFFSAQVLKTHEIRFERKEIPNGVEVTTINHSLSAQKLNFASYKKP